MEEFAIRPHSGGLGRYAGGNGVMRRIRFRETMTAAIISGHRRVQPFGLQQGEPGKLGKNSVKRRHGALETVGSNAQVTMEPGDVFIIETPGGGGFGEKQ